MTHGRLRLMGIPPSVVELAPGAVCNVESTTPIPTIIPLASGSLIDTDRIVFEAQGIMAGDVYFAVDGHVLAMLPRGAHAIPTLPAWVEFRIVGGRLALHEVGGYAMAASEEADKMRERSVFGCRVLQANCPVGQA